MSSEGSFNDFESSKEYALEDEYLYEETEILDSVTEENVISPIDTYSGSDNVEQAIINDDDNRIKANAIEDEIEQEQEDDCTLFDLRKGIIAQAILERPFK